MTRARGRDVPEARRTQPSRIAHDHIQDTSRRLRRRLVLVPDEGGVLAVRRPKSCGRTPGTRTKLGEAERRFWRGGRLRRPQQAAFLRCALVSALAMVLLAPLLLGSCRSPGAQQIRARTLDDSGTYNWLMFHGDRARTGWNSNETVLTPANVSGSAFGVLWSSPVFDSFGGTPAHMYASPLYVDDVTLSTPDLPGQHLSVVVAATSNSYVYAVNAFDAPGVPAG